MNPLNLIAAILLLTAGICGISWLVLLDQKKLDFWAELKPAELVLYIFVANASTIEIVMSGLYILAYFKVI